MVNSYKYVENNPRSLLQHNGKFTRMLASTFDALFYMCFVFTSEYWNDMLQMLMIWLCAS